MQPTQASKIILHVGEILGTLVAHLGKNNLLSKCYAGIALKTLTESAMDSMELYVSPRRVLENMVVLVDGNFKTFSSKFTKHQKKLNHENVIDGYQLLQKILFDVCSMQRFKASTSKFIKVYITDQRSGKMGLLLKILGMSNKAPWAVLFSTLAKHIGALPNTHPLFKALKKRMKSVHSGTLRKKVATLMNEQDDDSQNIEPREKSKPNLAKRQPGGVHHQPGVQPFFPRIKIVTIVTILNRKTVALPLWLFAKKNSNIRCKIPYITKPTKNAKKQKTN
jgi:hypothetical protein